MKESTGPGTKQLVDTLRCRTDALIRGEGIDPSTVEWVVEDCGRGISVHYIGPGLRRGTREALGVRLLDAVGDLGRTVGDVHLLFDQGM